MIFVLIFILALVVLAVLVEPYFRKAAAPRHLDEEDYLVAQLDDIARDRAAGLISEEEAAEAEREARRRLLAAASAETEKPPARSNPVVRQASIVVIAAAPLAAIVLYVMIGNPAQEVTPKALEIAQRARLSAPGTDSGNTGEAGASLTQSVNALEQRLAENPGDLDGWIRLGEGYARMDRYAEAATAFGKARELAPDRAFLHAAEGEALAMANGGVVSDDARAAFERALERDAGEPRARFYLALDAYQQGEKQAALDALVSLANNAPAGAPWAPIVRSQIEAIAGELGQPVDTLGLEAPAPQSAESGPTQEDMQAAAGMSADDRTAMIESMVAGLAARLEEEPDDLEGWTMLARSYAVLGEMPESADAYARAAGLAPDDINLRLGRAEALLAILREKGAPIDEEAKAAIDEVSRLNPEHPFALYFQGLAASQRGDAARAKSYWERLLAVMPEGTEDAESVKRMIEAL